MQEKKHFNKGQEIAVTFPISPEQIKQQELNKQLEKELAKTIRQNKKQAKMLKQLEDKVKKDN